LVTLRLFFRTDKQNDVAVPATYHPVPAPDWAATPAMKPQIGIFINNLFLAAIMVSVAGISDVHRNQSQL
jgi:hypothetical protein